MTTTSLSPTADIAIRTALSDWVAEEPGTTTEWLVGEILSALAADRAATAPDERAPFEAWFEEWRVSTWWTLRSEPKDKPCPAHWNMNAKQDCERGWLARAAAPDRAANSLAAPTLEDWRSIQIYAAGAERWLNDSAGYLLDRKDNAPYGWISNAIVRMQFIQDAARRALAPSVPPVGVGPALDAVKTDPELLALLKAAANRVMTPEEAFEQRVSFVYGCMKMADGISKERVRDLLRSHPSVGVGREAEHGSVDSLACSVPPAAALGRVEEDAKRYRLLRRGQHWSVIDGAGDTLRAEALDAAIDRITVPAAALRQVTTTLRTERCIPSHELEGLPAPLPMPPLIKGPLYEASYVHLYAVAYADASLRAALNLKGEIAEVVQLPAACPYDNWKPTKDLS